MYEVSISPNSSGRHMREGVGTKSRGGQSITCPGARKSWPRPLSPPVSIGKNSMVPWARNLDFGSLISGFYNVLSDLSRKNLFKEAFPNQILKLRGK